jgi:hypothetical protein
MFALGSCCAARERSGLAFFEQYVAVSKPISGPLPVEAEGTGRILFLLQASSHCCFLELGFHSSRDER